MSNASFDSTLENVVKELDKISFNTDKGIMGSSDLIGDGGNSSDSNDDSYYHTKVASNPNLKTASKSQSPSNLRGGNDGKSIVNVETLSFHPLTVISDTDNDKDVVYKTQYALNFTPSPDQVVATMKDGEKFRFIFCNQKYTDEEKELIDSYKRHAISSVKNIDKNDPNAIKLYYEHFKDSIFTQDHYILRYLQGNSFNPAKTYVDVNNHLKWRSENLPINFKQVEPFLDMGFCYVFGMDKCARPIVVIRLSKANNLKKEVMLRVLYYWLETIICKILIPGRVEQWRILVDLASYNLFNMPISFLKDASKFLTINYRSRLSGMIILNAPYMVSGVWKVIKGLLPVYTREKIIITYHNTCENFLSLVDKSQVETRYGGSAKNNVTFRHPVFPPLN